MMMSILCGARPRRAPRRHAALSCVVAPPPRRPGGCCPALAEGGGRRGGLSAFRFCGPGILHLGNVEFTEGDSTDVKEESMKVRKTPCRPRRWANCSPF